MNNRVEGGIAILAAILVLFSAMWDARVSAIVAFAALVGLGVYRLLQKGH